MLRGNVQIQVPMKAADLLLIIPDGEKLDI